MDAVISSGLFRLVMPRHQSVRVLMRLRVMPVMLRRRELHSALTASQYPGDGRHRWCGRSVAQAILDETVTDLPTENPRILLLVLFNLGLNLRRSNSRFGATYHPWSYRSSLLVPIQDFGDTTMTDTKLSGYNTRSNSCRSHLNDSEPDMVWQRPAIDEHTTKLIDPALS